MQVNFRLPKRMLALVGVLLLTVSAFAQQIAVKGHVKDETGEPITGATVAVGGKPVVVTDIDGNFQLKAARGAQLTITFMGFLPKTVAASQVVSVTLVEDTKALDELVVIGYGRARKSDLTGSVTAIKPDEENHGLQTTATDMLQGKVAGLSVISNDGTPGAGAQIRIRGGSSLNASNDPLIVIDGLAMDSYGVKGLSNPLAMVNPADIETFTVLKDASATAIYGSRASNGVIIITTKKGRSGSKPTITYNANVSVSKVLNTPDVMDGNTYRQFIADLYGENSDAYKALGYTKRDGTKAYANTDWQDEILRTAWGTDHNLTIAGGMKHMPYRVSFGLTENQGVVKTSSFERYNLSVNLAPEFFDKHLKFNISGKAMIGKNRFIDGSAIGAARWMDPTKPVKADDDIYNTYFGGYTQWYSPATYDDNTWKYTSNSNGTKNPVATLEQYSKRATPTSLVGNIEVDYAIHGLEDLHLHVNAGGSRSSGREITAISPYSGSNNYYGYYGRETANSYNMQLNTYAQYMKQLSKAHHIDVMAGYEWQHYYQYTNGRGWGLYPSTHNTMAGQHFNETTGETRYKTENYLVSFFGRANYTLLDRYMLTATIRNDRSSRFSKDNRSGIFPSVAAAWRINEEGFLKNVKAINDFKLRLGYGVTGQQDGIGDYTYIPTYTPNLDHAYYPILDDGSTYRPDAYNGSLTWEKTTTWNAGIDLSLLNDRLVFNVDYYYRKTTDLLNDVFVKTGSNFSPKVKSNIGSLHNTGVEFATTVRPIATKDWNWELNYNITYNHNEIDELSMGKSKSYFVVTGGISAGTGGNIQAHTVGHAASSFFVYQQVYDQNGKPVQNTFVDRDGNGSLGSGDRYYYYKPAADVTMGLSSKLRYKNWDFGFSMRASLGNYVYNDNLAGSYNTGAGAIYTLGYLGNRMTDAVALGFNAPITEQVYSDLFVENASFLRMDNITLGYSFKNAFGTRLNGRVYGTVQNVFTVTKYSGVDPEVASGIDNSLYPRPFTTVVGVTLNY